MDWQELAYRFQFYDNGPLDKQIDSITNVDPHAFVHNGKLHLREDLEATFAQFVRLAGVVRTLEQSRSQHRVHPDRRVDDDPSDVIDLHGWRFLSL